MKIFVPKHQKLILQCYPPGKHVDKSANSSELAYFIYYATTRRTKLEKIMIFLKEKSQSDVKSKRSGNLNVTLQLLESLIINCKDSLNVFAKDTCTILSQILSLSDYQLSKLIVSVYHQLTLNLNLDLFIGDKSFISTFNKLSTSLINIPETNGPNSLIWKSISLLSIQYSSLILPFNQELESNVLSLSLPILINIIESNINEQDLFQLIVNNVNMENNDSNLNSQGRRFVENNTKGSNKIQKDGGSAGSRILDEEKDIGLASNAIDVSSNKSLNVPAPNLSKIISKVQSRPDLDRVSSNIYKDFLADNITDQHIIDQSFICLKTLFNSNLSSQVERLSIEVVKYNFNQKLNVSWGSTFFELCTTWIPIQLRFVSLTTLLNYLLIKSKDSNSFKFQTLISNYILTLISSKINLIGLSISDIIQQLLSLQSNLILIQSDSSSSADVDNLSSIYSDCICNLSTHIYYFDQIPDSIEEILLKINSTIDIARTSKLNDKLSKLVLTLLNDIQDIFIILKKNNSSISRNFVQLDNWISSLEILDLNPKDYRFTPNQISLIQDKFLEIFDEFINNELTNSNKSNSANSSFHSITTEERIINHAKVNNDAKIFLQPDFNQYITVGNNFINSFLISVDNFLNNKPNHLTSEIMMDVLIDLTYTLGINFISNFIPFFYHWTSPQNGAQSNTLHVTFGYTIIYYSIKVFDGKYPELEGYAGKSKLGKYILKDIETRKLNGLWEFGLDKETGEEIKSRNRDAISFNTNKETIEEFIIESNYLSQWIDSNSPLVLDLIKNQKNSVDYNDIESNSNLSYNHFKQNGKSIPFGLGTSHDIISIHSGINGNAGFSKTPLPPLPGQKASSLSPDVKVYNSPRVSDLKGLFKEPKGSLINFDKSSNQEPVNVNRILDNLFDEDDRRIVV